jgi:hypothetical protein
MLFLPFALARLLRPGSPYGTKVDLRSRSSIPTCPDPVGWNLSASSSNKKSGSGSAGVALFLAVFLGYWMVMVADPLEAV